MTPNTPNLGAGDLGWPRKSPFLIHETKSSILVYNLPRFENLWILTPNDPKYPPIWGRMTSGDLGNHFFVIRASRASFWYIVCLGLKIFGFWPQMNQMPPDSGSDDLGWPRKPPFCIQGAKSFILVYNLPRFENLWILTPNDPKCPWFGVGWPRVTSETTFL